MLANNLRSLAFLALPLALGVASAACSSSGQVTGSNDGGGSGSGSGGGSGSSGSGSSGSGSSGSGSSGSGSSGSGSSGSGSSGSGSSSGGQGCPATVPAQGAACTPILACEYDVDSEGACGTVAECSASTANGPFTWQITTPPAGCGTHGPTCPASFTGRPIGTTCNLTDPICDYTEGRCACAPCLNGTSEGTWACQAWSTGGNGCPTPRPTLGSACTAAQEGVSCNYQFFCSGIPSEGPGMVCTNGTWAIGGVIAGVCIAPPSCGIQDGGTD